MLYWRKSRNFLHTVFDFYQDWGKSCVHRIKPYFPHVLQTKRHSFPLNAKIFFLFHIPLKRLPKFAIPLPWFSPCKWVSKLGLNIILRDKIFNQCFFTRWTDSPGRRRFPRNPHPIHILCFVHRKEYASVLKERQ